MTRRAPIKPCCFSRATKFMVIVACKMYAVFKIGPMGRSIEGVLINNKSNTLHVGNRINEHNRGMDDKSTIWFFRNKAKTILNQVVTLVPLHGGAFDSSWSAPSSRHLDCDASFGDCKRTNLPFARCCCIIRTTIRAGTGLLYFWCPTSTHAGVLCSLERRICKHQFTVYGYRWKIYFPLGQRIKPSSTSLQKRFFSCPYKLRGALVTAYLYTTLTKWASSVFASSITSYCSPLIFH